MKNFTILAGALVLAACGGAKEDTTTIETNDGKVQLSVDENGEGGSYRITTEDGVMTAQSGGSLNVQLPAGYSLYPGANVVSQSTIKTDQGSNLNVAMEIAGGADPIVDFYRKQATAAGVSIESEIKTGEMQIISGKDKAGMVFSLSVFPGGDGKSTATLTLAQDKGV